MATKGRGKGSILVPELSHIEVLKEIRTLLSALLKATLAERMETLLPDHAHRLLYNQTGRIPVKELARKTKFSAGKISGIWQRWEQAGLLVREGKSYRKLL